MSAATTPAAPTFTSFTPTADSSAPSTAPVTANAALMISRSSPKASERVTAPA